MESYKSVRNVGVHQTNGSVHEMGYTTRKQAPTVSHLTSFCQEDWPKVDKTNRTEAMYVGVICVARGCMVYLLSSAERFLGDVTSYTF